MSIWIQPGASDLKEVISVSEGELLLCSPYVSIPGLSTVANVLPNSVHTIEFWTKLNGRDWLTGASDPEGLLNFLRALETQIERVAIRHSDILHAKMIVSDGPKALAGSANLTRGGFGRNVEVARVVTGSEITELRELAVGMRPWLTPMTLNQLEEFVSECTAHIDSKEALLDLIRQELPAYAFSQSVLLPYRDFLSYLRTRRSRLASEILRIATNADNNNNTGKVKQAFYGVQRFLQEYPQYFEYVETLSVRNWFDAMQSDLSDDWLEFLYRFSDEVNPAYEYSIPTLRGYLPVAQGGTLVGGGGGSNELKRVWPYVARSIQHTDARVRGASP